MNFKNTQQNYGLISALLHWGMAVTIIGLYFLGLYMVSLDYYHPWYQKAPDLHRSFGIAVGALLVFRLIWRLSNPRPDINGRAWEQHLAIWVHRLFYLLISAIVIGGYMITTADGQAVSMFGWFEIPASVYGFANQEDIAGFIHKWLANLLIALVLLHTSAALKHHFINRDATLIRMLSPGNFRNQRRQSP